MSSAKRLPQLPEVPTLNELGYTGMEDYTWVGIFAPAGTPADVVARLNSAFTEALRATEVRSRFATLMAEPTPSTPQQFDDFMKRERAKYERVVKLSGAKVD